SLIHARPSNLIISGGAAGPGMAMAGRERDGRVLVDGRGVRPGKGRDVEVADAGGERGKKPSVGPKKDWQEALVRGVNEPGLIIATADFLVQNGKFDHAAEFLKANLRSSIVVKPWVYRSLAIALRESGGSAEEIERAEVSTADLEPLD